jgi:hypothetical protein
LWRCWFVGQPRFSVGVKDMISYILQQENSGSR